jgi:predicted metalloprotease with PDZ domain
VWIPGSYMVREFSKHLQNLVATQSGKPVQLVQLDKCTWQAACKTTKALELHYEVYAFDTSVRTAYLDAQRGFFNPSSLCLRVEGLDDVPHAITVKRPAHVTLKNRANYDLITPTLPLKVNKNGFGSYLAPSYDALVDSPFEMGAMWVGSFSVRGVPHRFAVAGAPPGFDGDKLLSDTQRIVEAEIEFWHGSKGAKPVSAAKPPFKHYDFMLNVVDEGYGGLEHAHSTVLICGRRDLPRKGVATSEGYTTLMGLISHEYFHTWNVKRLRPVEFKRYQYQSEQYTQMLWFFEGFTSYYDDLLLRRAGLLDNAGYLKLLGKTINQVLQTPGRHVQSVAQSSFDAWVKYYRQDENSANATVSYYTKGALVALCFDLALRARGCTLDAVMRQLYAQSAGGPINETDFAHALLAVSGKDFSAEIAIWVHGKTDLPVEKLLTDNGINIQKESATLAQRLGIRVAEVNNTLTIKVVLRGSLAEAAGMAAGDEWLACNGWRMHKLDDFLLYKNAENQKVQKSKTAASKREPTPQTATNAITLSRDKRLLHLSLPTPAFDREQAWALRVHSADKANAWLDA